MGNDNWITTKQLIENLKKDSGREHEYRRCIGGYVSSTRWMIYDPKRGKIGVSVNIGYDWYTEEELIKYYGDAFWHRDA